MLEWTLILFINFPYLSHTVKFEVKDVGACITSARFFTKYYVQKGAYVEQFCVNNQTGRVTFVTPEPARPTP